MVIFLYVAEINLFSINAPYSDDFNAVLGFLNSYQNLEWREKIKLIFSQHNEHRIVFNRLIALAYLEVFEKINFIYLAWIGAFGWFLVIGLLWRYSNKNEVKIYEFAPVVVLLLAFTHWELMTWAMASIQQYYQILFGLLAIYCMTNNQFWTAQIFFVIGLFTGGGGIIVAPIFCLYYFVQAKWRCLIYTSIVILSTFFIYFILLDYQHPLHHPSIVNAISSPKQLLIFFFLFLGAFSWGNHYFNILFGAILLALFLRISRSLFVKFPFFGGVAFLFF